MGSALDRFRTMMRHDVAPELRRMGFRGPGQSFMLPSEDHWVLLGFQKSRSRSAREHVLRHVRSVEADRKASPRWTGSLVDPQQWLREGITRG
jgi:hypothetical protein